MATFARTLTRTAALAALLVAPGCGLDKQTIPSISGPSGLSLDVAVTASPEFLPRDGVSSSVITVTLRDVEGRPAARRALRLTAVASPGVGGKLDATQAETDANGRASVVFTAPGVSDNVNEVVIAATPLTGNADTNLTHSVRIRVIGPTLPVPNFTFSPTAPMQFEKVGFDASSTTVGGAACTTCTYSWAFGSESTGTGSFTQYQFKERGSYAVTLTVTTSGGASTQITKVVSVSAPIKPTASFVVSPTNPRVGETVFFNAAASTSPSGTPIARYNWDFGNGVVDGKSEPTASVVYEEARTYTVTLTVEDVNGVVSTAATTTVSATAVIP